MAARSFASSALRSTLRDLPHSARPASRLLSTAAGSSSSSSGSTLLASASSSSSRSAFVATSSRWATPSTSSPFSTSSRAMAADEAKKEGEAEAEAAAEGKEGSVKQAEAKEGDGANAEIEKKLKEKDAQIKELQDKLLYQAADMQTLRRRAAEEKTQAADFGITKLARDLTESLDILALALRSVPENLRAPAKGDEEGAEARKVLGELYGGVELTSKSITDMLKRHDVTEFDPTGEKFDPQAHEALYQAPVPGKEPGTVLECSKKGFRIKGRILRAAQVGVVQG